MTQIALVVPQPAMPGYNHAADLDEVHQLTRYCSFTLTSLGGLHLLFSFFMSAKNLVYINPFSFSFLSSASCSSGWPLRASLRSRNPKDRTMMASLSTLLDFTTLGFCPAGR